MAIVSKISLDGVDIVIDALQQNFFARLLGFWDGSTVYTMYPRANKNYDKDQIIPEVSLDEKDYKETLFDDTVFVNSFFLADDARGFQDVNRQIKQRLSLIFQADLVKLYGGAERLDERFNMDVLRVLRRDNRYIFGDITIDEGINNVYRDLNLTGKFKEQIKYSDISNRHVVKFTFDVIYKPNCVITTPPVCVPATETFNGDSISPVSAGTNKDIIVQTNEAAPVQTGGILTDTPTQLIIEVDAAGTTPVNSADMFKTGAETIFQSGDDGTLQQGRGVDFFTLEGVASDWPHNSTDRFTDDLLGQDYVSNVIVDWSTYNQIGSTVLCYYKVLEPSKTLTNQISEGPYTRASFPNWYGCNYKQLINMFNLDIFRNYMNYPPFNHDVSSTSERVWTITRENISNGIFYSGALMSVSNQSGLYRLLLQRTYTLSELGL